MSLFAKAADLENQTVNAAICTIVKERGSTPRKAGAKMIVIESDEPFGTIVGTIGGGAIEHLVRKKALEVIRHQQPELLVTSLRNELGMCCGGEMSIFIEPIVKKPKLICFGAGHIAQSLCPLAFKLGYQVSVVDERRDLLKKDAFLESRHFHDSSAFSIGDMPFGPNTFLVITTHDHDLDQRIVEAVLGEEFKYGALVGSQRKALMTKKRLLAKGFSEHVINRIVCPAGININAKTPEEIALSIMAEITLVKNDATKNWSPDRSGWQQSAHGL